MNTALSAVKKYADVREGMFPQRQAVTQTEFFSGEAAARARDASARVAELVQTAAQLQAEEGRLLAKQAALQPWEGTGPASGADGHGPHGVPARGLPRRRGPGGPAAGAGGDRQ